MRAHLYADDDVAHKDAKLTARALNHSNENDSSEKKTDVMVGATNSC